MCGVSAQLTTIDAPTAIVCGDHCHWPAVSKVVYCSSCRVLSKGLIQPSSRRPSAASDMSGCAAPAPAGSGHSTRLLPAASVGVSGCDTCWPPASNAPAAIPAMATVLMADMPTPAAPAQAYPVAPRRLKTLLQKQTNEQRQR